MVEREKVVGLLHEIAKKTGATIPKGTSKKQIDAFAERTGLIVPLELREWLQLYNGILIGSEGIYGIEPANSFLDTEDILRLQPSWREKGWIPIAGDGCGGYYVLATKSITRSGHPVFFIDETSYDTPAYVVASGLWAFLRFYLQEAMGQDFWPFDEGKVIREDPVLAEYSEIKRPWEVS